MSATTVDPARAALLVMDMQQPFLRQCPDRYALVGRINPLLHRSREAGPMIVVVRVAFRRGYPELGDHVLGDVVRPAGILVEGTEDTAVPPDLAVTDDDLLVTKHRTSALHGNDLDLILRAHRVDTLVLTGFSTAGVVLATACGAFDQDYRVVVPHDCCSDPDPEMHAMLTTTLLPRKGTVVASDDLVWAAVS